MNQQPTVRVVIGPLLSIALIALELENLADVLEGQVERRLPKLLHELPGVCFVARRRQLVMDCKAHIVSLAFMVRCPGQFVTHEVPPTPTTPTRRLTLRAAPGARQSVWMLLTGRTNGLMLVCR